MQKAWVKCPKHGKPQHIDNTDYEQAMASLPNYQGKASRHKCTYCAYGLGLEDGFKEAKKLFMKQQDESL